LIASGTSPGAGGINGYCSFKQIKMKRLPDHHAYEGKSKVILRIKKLLQNQGCSERADFKSYPVARAKGIAWNTSTWWYYITNTSKPIIPDTKIGQYLMDEDVKEANYIVETLNRSELKTVLDRAVSYGWCRYHTDSLEASIKDDEWYVFLDDDMVPWLSTRQHAISFNRTLLSYEEFLDKFPNVSEHHTSTFFRDYTTEVTRDEDGVLTGMIARKTIPTIESSSLVVHVNSDEEWHKLDDILVKQYDFTRFIDDSMPWKEWSSDKGDMYMYLIYKSLYCAYSETWENDNDDQRENRVVIEFDEFLNLINNRTNDKDQNSTTINETNQGRRRQRRAAPKLGGCGTGLKPRSNRGPKRSCTLGAGQRSTGQGLRPKRVVRRTLTI
jgi:hypothetical protein